MSDLVYKILKKRGPLLSSAVAFVLVEEHGLTAATARKRISRAGENIRRQAFLTFPRNAQFLYLKEHYGSSQFWSALIEALMEKNTAYGLALAAVKQRDGICPKAHFPIACGSPERQLKHLPWESVLGRLIGAKLLEEIDIPGLGPCICLSQSGKEEQFLQREATSARLICEAVLLKAVKAWIRNLGFGSYDKVRLRDEGDALPKVATCRWDLAAPSYVAPLVQEGKDGIPKPGFVVCDILLVNSRIDEQGLRPFLNKCRSIRQFRNVGRCLQIFVANGYTERAFNLARKSGVIAATPESLFGEEVAKALKELASVLQYTASHTEPEIFSKLFNTLGKIEGAAVNLRGALFEVIAMSLVRATEPSNCQVILNRIFRAEPDKKAEVDVMVLASRRWARFIECKGYQPNGLVDDKDIERWLNHCIPTVRGEARQNPEMKSAKHTFEFWTTGKISAKALDMIESAKSKTQKYSIDFFDAQDVLDLALEAGEGGIAQLLRDHFLQHPLATAEEAVARERRRAERKALRQEALTPNISESPPWMRGHNSHDDEEVPF